MEVRQFIRPDIAVSAIAHLSVLALVILFTEVHPFGSVTAEPIAVDLVTSDEVPKQPDPTPTPTPTPTPQFSLPDLKSSTQPETPNAASRPASLPSRQKQPAITGTASSPQSAGGRSSAAAANRGSAAAASRASIATWAARRNRRRRPRRLHHPAMRRLSPMSRSTSCDAGPARGPVGSAAELSRQAFRTISMPQPRVPALGHRLQRDRAVPGSHLKTCAKLPATVAPTDHIMVKLRVMMTPDGRLASRPLVGGGKGMKAFDLVKSAIDALQLASPTRCCRRIVTANGGCSISPPRRRIFRARASLLF